MLMVGRIPLNDDRQEKAKRFQSRQAFHNAQLDSIKAAASPVRKRKSFGPNGDGPNTPQQGDDEDIYIGGAAVTPMKRVPILANFEEWMKMATDNVSKIGARQLNCTDNADRKSMRQTPGTLRSSTIFTTCRCFGRVIVSTFKRQAARSMDV